MAAFGHLAPSHLCLLCNVSFIQRLSRTMMRKQFEQYRETSVAPRGVECPRRSETILICSFAPSSRGSVAVSQVIHADLG